MKILFILTFLSIVCSMAQAEPRNFNCYFKEVKGSVPLSISWNHVRYGGAKGNYKSEKGLYVLYDNLELGSDEGTCTLYAYHSLLKDEAGYIRVECGGAYTVAYCKPAR